jgi:ubiquinol-cytochrome c reductase iron-sulfur subunit
VLAHRKAAAIVKKWAVSGFLLFAGRRRRRSGDPPRIETERAPIVPPGDKSPRAELVVVALFVAAGICAAGFIVVFALGEVPHRTQFLGLAIGLAFALIAVACIVVARRLVVTEELEEDYQAPEHPDEQEAVEEIVKDSGSRFTRKRLVTAAAAATGGAVTAALIAPAVSLGPILDTSAFYETPWRRGRRLVDESGKPLHAHDIFEKTFYTAFPEGAEREDFGAPLVVVRLEPEQLKLPSGRSGWAPDGILAYSKICTHAGCAVALFRTPLFPPAEPKPALVCPCHYSTFDVATGGTVIFGPAGRPLPQLPLEIDDKGFLRASGNFSGAVGPAWWGVYMNRLKP